MLYELVNDRFDATQPQRLRKIQSTLSVWSIDPQASTGSGDEFGWNDSPAGHISLSEAAQRTAHSAEWLRRLAKMGKLNSVRRKVGRRTRIWIPEEAIRKLAHSFGNQGHGNRSADDESNSAAPTEAYESRELLVYERDRWRSEALRVREAGLRMAAAFDALNEADQLRTAAMRHIRDAADSLDNALRKAREAADQQNQALREFMIPTDMHEN